MATEPSILSEVDPNSIDLLMEKDPLDLTESDEKLLIHHLRAERIRYAQLEAEGKRMTKPRKKKASASGAAVSVNLEDLGL